jgi:hypothetical protein
MTPGHVPVAQFIAVRRLRVLSAHRAGFDFGVICCMFLRESLRGDAGIVLESPDQKI